MPSIVGNIKISNVGAGSIVQIGDAVQLAPESTSKIFAGSGSFNVGDFPVTNNAISNTNTSDNDVADASQQTVGNKGVV
ncbi:spore germination protein [Paenibacillus doosanensis]|uniref:Spore germination protein GerPA n=1 Tax=Paenibacillus konkukensis TaxID=2020716 RepID=A0ABY4S0L8_9BACL|nr:MULTISPECIES: spore germination protein [Paenibacillus]MCS7461807.1 spore germination protein [Paenibacillus doosanensis]UQZ87425.1 putative spore germination protein GerPA [Paenibacillus konkukensis]